MKNKEEILKELEEGIRKSPCSDILEPEDYEGRTMEELPEILGHKLIPHSLRIGFNAGVQFAKEVVDE